MVGTGDLNSFYDASYDEATPENDIALFAQARLVGLGISQAEGTSANIDWNRCGGELYNYLERLKPAERSAAFAEISTLNVEGLNSHQIAAMRLGLSREEVTDKRHSWEERQGKATVNYIAARPSLVSASQAFAPICGESATNIAQIQKCQEMLSQQGLTKVHGYMVKLNAETFIRIKQQIDNGLTPHDAYKAVAPDAAERLKRLEEARESLTRRFFTFRLGQDVLKVPDIQTTITKHIGYDAMRNLHQMWKTIGAEIERNRGLELFPGQGKPSVMLKQLRREMKPDASFVAELEAKREAAKVQAASRTVSL